MMSSSYEFPSLPRYAVRQVEDETEKRAQYCRVISDCVRGLTQSDGGHPYIDSAVAKCYHRIKDSEIRGLHTIDCCRIASRLYPAEVDGYGNHLESALVFALWGLSSELAVIHRLLYVTIIEFGELRYRERWQRQCEILGILEFSSWEKLVQSTVSLTARVTKIQSDADTSFSAHLKEAMQVFIFANVLRRPIIVLSNYSHVQGVYLPLLFASAKCIKHPLVLAYDNDRFVPLVDAACESDARRALNFVPLFTSELEPLRVWFLLEEEENIASDLELRYMNLSQMPLPNMLNANELILVAQLEFNDLGIDFASSGVVELAGVENEIRVVGAYPHLDPTAPPASISAHTKQQQNSLLGERCAQHNCQFYASIHTHPFCHEHVRRETTGHVALAALEPREQSMMTVRCAQAGCSNYASSFTYPYCYEHLDSKISDNLQKQERPASELRNEYMPSMLAETCVHPGCNNRSSVFTYPVCHEHQESFGSKEKLSLKENVLNQQTTELTINSASEVPPYERTIAEIEERSKKVAARCKNSACLNFGNSRSKGYCHDCFENMGQFLK